MLYNIVLVSSLHQPQYCAAFNGHSNGDNQRQKSVTNSTFVY